MSFQVASQLIVLLEIAAIAGAMAYHFGWFVGWATDKDQIPRLVMNGFLAVCGVNREADQLKNMMTMNLVFTSHQLFEYKGEAK